MTIIPITRKYFDRITSSPDITYTHKSTLQITLPKNLAWFRYFEIPGIGVFRHLPGLRRLLIPSCTKDIDVAELENSEIVVDSWDVKITDMEDKYPKNFYSRVSEIGVSEKSFTGERFNYPDEKLIGIINTATGRKLAADKTETRFLQLELIDTLHDDKLLCSIKEHREDWGGHYVSFLTEADIDLPLNVVESITNRLTALTIISIKYDG